MNFRRYTSEFGSWLAALLEAFGGSGVELEQCRDPCPLLTTSSDFELWQQHCIKDNMIIGDPMKDVLRNSFFIFRFFALWRGVFEMFKVFLQNSFCKHVIFYL